MTQLRNYNSFCRCATFPDFVIKQRILNGSECKNSVLQLAFWQYVITKLKKKQNGSLFVIFISTLFNIYLTTQ